MPVAHARPSPRPRPRPTLTGVLFAANVVLLAATLGISVALWTAQHNREIERHYEVRALAIARTVADLPEVRAGLTSLDPGDDLAELAERIRRSSGARYVVIADRDGIRYSHPQEEEIGRPVSNDPTTVLAGEEWTGVKEGPAGVTLRARVPVYGEASGSSGGAGEPVVGLVSVGILAEEIDHATTEATVVTAATALVALGLGAAGAYVISRRVRAKTHGLEPRQITELLDNREALLYAIREGVLALDADGRVALANEPARAMLELPDDCAGRRPEELGLDPRLCDILHGRERGPDLLVAVGARLLVCNRRGVRFGASGTSGASGDSGASDAAAGAAAGGGARAGAAPGPAGGAVVTMRDHTELARLATELDGARTVTRGLRAQSHEFANRIHTVAGMLHLGAVDQARGYLAELSAAHTRASTEIGERFGDVAVAALVLAKSAQAAERGASLELAPTTRLSTELDPRLRDDVLIVVGNLVDNALEAVRDEGWVELLVRELGPEDSDLDDGVVEIRVVDSGPGVPPDLLDAIFTPGFSTKTGAENGVESGAEDGPGDGRRGTGLALVRQACARWGGTVTVDSGEAGGETAFSAYLPMPGAGGVAAPGTEATGAGRMPRVVPGATPPRAPVAPDTRAADVGRMAEAAPKATPAGTPTVSPEGRAASSDNRGGAR